MCNHDAYKAWIKTTKTVYNVCVTENSKIKSIIIIIGIHLDSLEYLS